MPKYYDAIVIGGGVLGCFAARALTEYNISVCLLESEDDICTGMTAANTAIVYGSQDHHPNTEKARLCAEANAGFDKLCAELGVRFNRCGSLMVCFGEGGLKHLKRCYDRGVKMGVQGLELISGDRARKLEPGLSHNVCMALYAPNTGTVNPWELGIAAAENAAQNGAEIILNTRAESIYCYDGLYTVVTKDELYDCLILINCAGLNADTLCGTLTPSPIRIVPNAGDYIVLDERAQPAPKHIIFHEPEQRKKGITMVPTTDGNILLGPSERGAETTCARETAHGGLDFIRETAQTVYPSIPLNDTIRSFGALRANPYYALPDGSISDEKINDFEVFAPKQYPGFISFAGIKTPGLTCAYELTRLYVSRAIEDIGGADKNENYDGHRHVPRRLIDMTEDERADAYKDDPAWANIICRCKTVSEAEVRNAAERCFGKPTVEAVRRRCGAGLGRCQGSYCRLRIEDILK